MLNGIQVIFHVALVGALANALDNERDVKCWIYPEILGSRAKVCLPDKQNDVGSLRGYNMAEEFQEALNLSIAGSVLLAATSIAFAASAKFEKLRLPAIWGMMMSFFYYEIAVIFVVATACNDQGNFATTSQPIGLPIRGTTLVAFAALGIVYAVASVFMMATYSCWKQS